MAERFRQELDLTLSQLGELVGVNKIQVWKWETGRVSPPKSALLCTLFLKIIRSIGDRELQLATYPMNCREKLLLKSKKLDQIKDDLLSSQTEEVYRKASKLMKEELNSSKEELAKMRNILLNERNENDQKNSALEEKAKVSQK